MITKHQYVGEYLYLFFDYNYEFGKFTIKKDNKSYIDTIAHYIKKIRYKGSKIVIMVGSIIVLTLRQTNGVLTIDNYLTNEITKTYAIETKEDINIEPIKEEMVVNENIKENVKKDIPKSIVEVKEETQKQDDVVEQKQEVKEEIREEVVPEETWEYPINLVYNGNNIKIELEDYVLGVVAAEMPAVFNIEALKSQAVIARTYALNLLSKGNTLTNHSSIQAYINTNEMQNKWGSNYQKYYNKIKEAVSSTKGETIKYNGKYIDAVYHSTSNGYTEDSINVWHNDIPYLKSVDSSWDKNATSYLRDKTIFLEEFNRLLGINISSNDEIEALSKTVSNRIDTIKLGELTYTGLELRTILDLRSTDFDININGNNVIITTRGYGHGVGLSQYGANGMANSGYSYYDILKHYYQGITIN